MLLIGFQSMAQSQIGRQVIGSAGQDTSSQTISITSTVGESVVQTLSNQSIVTQGFHQPIEIHGRVSFTLHTQDATCGSQADGLAEVSNIKGCSEEYTVIWSNGKNEKMINHLAPGQYSVQIISSDSCQSSILQFTIKLLNPAPCKLHFYSGITPNNDGINDKWEIKNVNIMPQNKVEIYDRRGGKVFGGENYNNTTVVWEGNNLSGNPLPSGTYFFIFESDGFLQKGWIELSR